MSWIHNTAIVRRLYYSLTDSRDVPATESRPEENHDAVPGNFLFILIANTFNKLGDELSNAKTTLPWLLGFVGAPSYLFSLLVPIRESGALIPQLAISAFVKRYSTRKWLWSAGSILQGAMVILMALVAILMEGAAAGFSIVLLLVIFSLARCICSVSHKDVTGKTIPKTRRGQLGGISVSVSGLITLGLGLYYLMADLDQQEVFAITLLLILAGMAWVVAAFSFSQISEEPGESEDNSSASETVFSGLSSLKSDAGLRNFIVVRTLLLCSALSAPFYIHLATQSMGSGMNVLGAFILANGLASILSGPFWGRQADRSSRSVMISTAFASALLGVMVISLSLGQPGERWSSILYPFLFFLLGVTHNGVRLGRKTYLVDMATGNQRTEYVALSNTAIGINLLILGVLTSAISAFSPLLALGFLTISGALGGFLARRLDEVQQG